MGGCNATDRDTVPLCPECHAFVDRPGGSEKELERRWNVDLRAIARALAEKIYG